MREFCLANCKAKPNSLRAMSELPQSNTGDKVITALLCLATGDASEVAFAPCLGKPLIYHQIMALQRAGIHSVRIYVEAVSGVLLTTIDLLRFQGFDVRAVRSVDELTATLGEGSQLLVLQSDLWWQAEWLAGIIKGKRNTVFVLAEQTGIEAFERIDLNSRWSGLVLCDARILPALGDIPEGWDLSSLLLRQAQQAGFENLMLPHSVLTVGELRKIDAIKGSLAIENAVSDALTASADTIDSHLVINAFRRLRGWGDPQHWSHLAGLWTPLASAGISAVLAFSGYQSAAFGFACLSVLSQPIRKFLRMIGYRTSGVDPVQAITNVALLVALYFCLAGFGAAPIQAGFLTLALAGILLGSAGRAGEKPETRPYRVSLLFVTVLLLIGQLAGYLEFVIMFVILLLIASWLIPLRRAGIQA
jgi:hypothetical protein